MLLIARLSVLTSSVLCCLGRVDNSERTEIAAPLYEGEVVAGPCLSYVCVDWHSQWRRSLFCIP